MRLDRLLLFVLLVPTLLLTVGQHTLWAQCSTCSFTAATGGNYTLSGNQTLCVTGNVGDFTLTSSGVGNKICVAPGATWTISSGLNFSTSLTIDVYGTLNANGSYNVNGTGNQAVFNIKVGGVMNTNTGGFSNNIRINNEGKLTFTNTAQISNSGTFTLVNATTGVMSATATSLFLLGTNTYVENYNSMTFSNLENSESDIRNAEGATITIGRYFFNHGQIINDGLINTICGPFGSAACEFIVGDKGPGKIFSITNTGCMKVVGNTRFDGIGFISGTLEITGNLDINKAVSGSGGRIIVNNGVSTIAVSGAYNGTNMKFCDKNTTSGAGGRANGFDVVNANNSATNVVYTVDCSANTCGAIVAPVCALTVTATPGTCNPATNQYTVTGTLSFTNVPAGTVTLSDASGSTLTKSLTLSVPASTTSLAYSFSGLTSGGRIHTLTATFSSTACAPKSLTYLSPVSCTAAACVGTNLLLNPSFEQGFPSPPTGQQTQVPPPSWTGGTADNNPTGFAAAAGYAYGFSGDAGATLCQSVSATPGGTYNLAFFAGVHEANGQTVTLSFLNGSTVLTPVRSYTISHILDISSGGSGTFGGPYSLSGVAPAGTTQARVCAVSANGAGYLYWAKIDNLCLTTQAPVCSLSAVATRTACTSATNSYTATVAVTLTNTAAGTITVSIPGSTPISQTIAANITSFSAVFGGLISDGLSHTATVSLPGCGTTTAVYTAPASCSVAPPCNLSATVTPTACNSVSNGYGINGVITLTNSPLSQTITLTDGSFVRSLTASAGTTTITYSYSNVLQSNGLIHTLTLTSSATACGTFSTTYTAPVACTVAPPVLAVVVGTPVCNSVTNTYTATGTVSLSNAVASSLTITDNGTSLTTISISAGQTTASFSVSGVSGSTPPSHTVVAMLTGNISASTTYATPASCTVCTVNLTTTTLPNGQVGTAYSQTLTTTGGATPYTYSLLGTLPTGLTLTASSGVISGNPTIATSASFSIKVTDSKSCTDVQPLSISTSPAPVCSLTATATPGTCNTLTNAYSVTGTVTSTNAAINNASPQTLTISVGIISTVVSLTGNGPVSYTLTNLNSDGLAKTVTALSSATACGNASVTYTAPASCTIAPPALRVVVSTPVCNSLTNKYTATGTVSLSNAVASTLTITDNGTSLTTISVTAGQTTASFSVTGISNASSHTVVATLTGGTSASTVYAAPVACTVCSLSLTTSTLPKGQVTVAYSQTISASGGTLPYNFSVAAGTLPAGLSLNPTTGVLSGTPTASGPFPTTLVVTDTRGCSVRLPLSVFQIDLAPQLGVSVVVNSPVCNSATNSYVTTGTVSLTNSPAGSLSITDGGITVAVIPVTAGQTSANFSLTGISDGPSVQLVSALLGTVSASTFYTKPASCTSGAPAYAIAKTVSQNRVEKGSIVTYTVSLTNIGNAEGTNLMVGDQLSKTQVTFVGNATASTGTFVPAANSGNWSITSLAAGQVATLSFQVQLNAEGITYNTATAPDGKTVVACVTVPFHICSNQPFEFALSAPTSLSTYQWSRDGVLIPGATSAVYNTTVVGEYTVATTNTTGCTDGSCCPLVIVADPAPSLSAIGVAATCTGGSPLNNAGISLVSSSTNAVSYNISLGSSFTASTPLFASNQPLSDVVGGLLLTSQANPAQAPGSSYTIRVYAANGCYSDVVVTIPPAQCVCPPAQCVPIMVKRVIKR